MRVLIVITQLFVLHCLLTIEAKAQNFPFPQNKVYQYGLMPANRSAQDAQKAYNTWKANFLTPCSNGSYRVKFDNPAQTVSEGIAYGMLLSAYAGEQTIFDGLWKYYQDHANSNGFMNWRIEGCGNASGFNGATDGDLDATMALVIAHYQWGSQGSVNYENVAKTYIAKIKQHEIEAGTFVLKPGDAFGGSAITNPSYFSPGYYRAFGQFTNDATFWNQVADKSYDIINKNLSVNNAVGGLVSDWTNANGSHSSQAGGYFNGGRRYHYDAARTPWRIATDYIWFGTAEAAAYCKKASDFVRVQLGGSANIKDGYLQNGTLYGQYHNSTFVGAFANAAIAGQQQAHLNDSYADLVNINDDNSYFNQSLKTLYLFQLTGNFFLPTSGGTPVNQRPQVAITSPTNSSSFEINKVISVKASASDVDGEVVKTELYVDGTKVAESANGTLTFDWQNSNPGSYVFTAKAYDNEGAQNASTPVTIDLFDPTAPQNCEGNLERPAGNWVVRNAWADQNNQSGTSAEGAALKVTHRIWGQDYLWVVNNTKELNLTPNQVYKVSFDLKVDPGRPVASIEAAFVSNVIWNGPQQIHATSEVQVTPANDFKTYTFNLKAPAGSKVLLGLKLNWNGQPSSVNHQLLKNIQVCSSNGAPPPPPLNQKPQVTIATPANAASFEINKSMTIQVNASDADGEVVKTALYVNDQKVKEVAGGSLSFDWQGTQTGNYVFEAKAYDNQNAQNTSDKVTVTITDNNAPPVVAGCQEQLTLPVSNWQVRNGWTDQNNQSGVSAEANTLKVTHRAWGQEFLWAVNTGKSFKLKANQIYELSFELKSSDAMPPSSLEVGLVSDVTWNGPEQVFYSAVIDLTSVNSDYQTYTVRLKAPSAASMRLGLKFNWNKQPPLASHNYVKGIRLCPQSKEKSRRGPRIAAYPNPSTDGVVRVKGIPANIHDITYILRNNQGKILTTGSRSTSQDKAFGLLQFDLESWMKNPGTYLLEIRHNDYRKMITILKK